MVIAWKPIEAILSIIFKVLYIMSDVLHLTYNALRLTYYVLLNSDIINNKAGKLLTCPIMADVTDAKTQNTLPYT